MKITYPEGATPLDLDEIAGLIPKHITTQGQLNEWEAANIVKAENWLFSNSSPGDILTLDFTKRLHKKMFDNTWKWAGLFRTTEKSIGIAPFYISSDLKNLLEDVRHQIEILINNTNITQQQIDEISYRFHHKLVAIHPFPNGNGRHARLMTDLLLIQAGYPRFTWGNKNLNANNPIRKNYIDALKDADKHDYKKLAAFVRS
jgi:Fic-DOC domain mobile mystery protein B